MRKLLLTIAILVLLIIAVAGFWIFAGSKISLLVDRSGIVETSSEKISSVRYEGNGTGGVLYLNQISLSLNDCVPTLEAPSIGSTKDGKLALASGGKVFPLGGLPKNESADTGADTLTTTPDDGDDARVSLGHSRLSWPTPFDLNFMTGVSPSWKRHAYQHLTWNKPNGARLEMVWRYEQYYYSANGWMSPTMTRTGQTGLIKIEIKP